MDEKLLDRIKKGLLRYEIKIEETNEHYDELKRLGRYTPSAPYRLKHLLPFWIHLLEKEGVNCEGLRQEYERITQKLEALEQKRGRDYREKLFTLLKDEVYYYPATIDSFADLEPFELEIPNDLLARSGIEILLIELERDHDLTEIKKKVSLLDEEFKSKYLQHIDEVIECCADVFDPYAPDSFWWEHPQKILKEKQAIQSNS
ncbi:hypothetical protein RJ40_09375 [Methanofollis aquaemaris]|uniref:Uncharacterized protein n=1 Tax=Methanofollis aquaemaris TaxID=126734 RepID=A0A8A3S6M3_9EURY|nr:hypothetical protein [Methanofollis aquaemaris]QSZ67702.1 hypothetical protein RJ40_09375 [Methanofollis aquaemaris]